MSIDAAERRLSALVEAGVVLASELDIEALLQRIADLAREILRAKYAAVGVLGEAQELVRFVYSGVDKQTADRIGDLPRGRGVLGVLIEEGKPLRLREISDHPRSYGFPEHHPPMRAFLGVPIMVRGRIFGRLYLTEKFEGEFTKDDERIALTLATQAGVAIENARLIEQVRQRSEELARRVAEISSVERLGGLLISTDSLDTILRGVADEARKLTGATRAILSILDEDTGDLVIRQAAGDQVAQDLRGTRLRQGASKAHAVLQRGTPEVVEDLSTDGEVDANTIARIGGPRQGGFIPLIVRDRRLGALAVYDRVDGISFTEDDLVVLGLLANQAAIAIENARLTDALRDLAVLEERERISKELHDGVIQSIYSVGLSLQGSLSMMNRDPEVTRTRIDDAIAELDNVVRDVRSYIFELRPKIVQELGMDAAVRELVKDLEVNTLAEVTVDLHDDACGSLDMRDQAHVIQIVREILSNIARHAQARQVWVSCTRSGEAIRLEIADDGGGFDPERVRRGHGLKNMDDRARSLGGELIIEPNHPRGTRHLLVVPGRGDG